MIHITRDIIVMIHSHMFIKEANKIAERLLLNGFNVWPLTDVKLSDREEITDLRKVIQERIQIADLVYVVDIDGYIDDVTKSLIDFAEKLSKPIWYNSVGGVYEKLYYIK